MKLGIRLISIAVVLGAPLMCYGLASALSDSQLNMFSQNDIMFYDPDECESSGGGQICGSTAKEKYWTALRATFGVAPAAGILGNIMNEGGFNPVQVESCDYLNPFNFYSGTWASGWSWDTYFSTDKTTGVGAFGITSGRSDYLHHVADTQPDLIQYFQHPEKYSNSCASGASYGLNSGGDTWGDALLNEIGGADYDRLVTVEVEWMKKMLEEHWDFDIEKFDAMQDPGDAAVYFAMHYERCAGCLTPGSSELLERSAAGKKAYDEMNGFTCAGGSSTSISSAESGESSGSGDDTGASGASSGSSSGATNGGSKVNLGKVTLIGDSIAVQSEAQLQAKLPDAFLSMVGSRHPTSKGMCANDGGGLDILRTIASGSGSVAVQHSNGQCDSIAVDSSSLGDSVVWELGTNAIGADSTGTLDQVLDLIGSRNLFLVTPYNGNPSNADTVAQLYRDYADEHDNVFVVDWNEAVRDNESKYITRADGMAVHPTDAGKQLMADLISQALGSATVCTSNDEFTYYNQSDPAWGSSPFGSSTVSASGCGPTSFAMMATVLLGHQITPTETAKIAGDAGMYVPGSGADWDITRVLAQHYGLQYEQLSVSSTQDAVSKISQYLKEGWMIHTSGAGSPPFTGGGHYIGIRGITSDGKWLLADSGHSEEMSTTPQDPMSVVTAGMNLGNIHAIKGSGTGTGKCANICKTSGGSDQLQDGGYTSVADAQGIIDAYLATNLNVSPYNILIVPHTGDRHHNCVAFSYWFLNYYTDLPVRTAPNGNQFVNAMMQSLGSSYPDLQISNTPSVYSVASWSSPTMGTSTGNHTGIVVGIDQERGKILIAEAGYDSPGFTGVHEYNLTEAVGSPTFQYVNVNQHLKSTAGLK